MNVERWSESPVEQLNPLVGRQMAHTETMTVARIVLAKGALVPRHQHENEQIMNVLEGRVRIAIGDEEQVLESGCTVLIPSGAPHEVEALEDSVALDVFSPVRDDWVRGDDAYLRR
jgi:quercetin dioxygenase-like cupin family protein